MTPADKCRTFRGVTTPLPADLARAVADRYDLTSVVGRGGMATVYAAHDRKHQRDVAMKVLRPEIASTIGADRFLKEIQIIARLVHPHILTLHDSGEVEGFVYYVMPLIAGGSLRDCMQREGRMTAERAIATAEPIADALEYAHQMGVLHRDIKPENVLFSRNHPIVADFGIAKAVSSANSGAQLTRTGISLGTPGYMSPEQAAGFTDTDAKTDVYSLAVLVYEMITGEIPGRWVLEDSTRAGRFLDAPAQHRPYLAAAGGTVERALVNALAIRPDQRTASPAGFIDALRGRNAAGKRRFAHDEVKAIVNRAAELEASNPTQSGALTMGGVERIAEDVGIDRALVRKAAREIAPAPTREARMLPGKRNLVLGGPTRLFFERFVEGELDEQDFPILVEEIRNVIQELGQIHTLGRSFTWVLNKGQQSTRNIEIAVSVRAGRTRIMVAENFNNLIAVVFAGGGIGVGAGGLGPLMAALFEGLNAASGAAAVFVPLWLALVYSGTRASYARIVQGREEKLRALADRLAFVTEELIGETSRPRLPGAPRPDALPNPARPPV